MSETQLYELMCQLVALVGGALALAFVVRRLARSQPGLAIGAAVAAAFGVRVLAAYGINATPSATTLRGGDELLFISRAGALADGSFVSSATLDALTTQFHVYWFSLTDRVFDTPPQMMLRIEVITIAVLGLALIAAAVYELAGPRAALIAAWVLAFEPANVFFSAILHKEPFMFAAGGLVVYGGARLWKRGSYVALIPMVVGCLLATATRPYAGWFLAAAAAAMALHAGLRRHSASSSVALSAVCIALMIAFVPTVWEASSERKLEELQQSQDANAADTQANLSLERVDYSTRENIIINLPERMVDVLTQPYPWQLENVSQQMGAVGTLFMFATLALLVVTLVKHGGGLMARAGPLIYAAIFLLMAYSLSAGNAGTAFRYRTHVVAFVIALVIVLRHDLASSKAADEPAPVAEHHPLMARGSAPTLAK